MANQPNAGRAPYGGRSREEYQALLAEKLSPRTLRFTLAFASLFQLTHELLKAAILDGVREFYWRGIRDGKDLYDETGYQRDVMEPSRRGGKANAFRGSVAWLVDQGAVADADAERLEAIYGHRHDLTHELGNFLIDVDKNPDLGLCVEALTILRKIQTFWAQLEVETGGFFTLTGEDVSNVTAEEAYPLLLDAACDALSARGFNSHKLPPGGHKVGIVNGCLIYVWRVPEDSNAIANFASSPTRQNGFSAPTPPAMLWEPTFDDSVPPHESSVDAGGTESTATLMAAVDDAMPVVLILVRSVPWQLQKIEWAVAGLNADGKVELHGLETIWEPELDGGDLTSDVEAFDSGTPTTPVVELQKLDRPGPDA